MQKISISGPAELVTIVPFHLGFQPERSVVVMCFVGRAIGLVARLDAVPPAEAARAAAHVTRAIRRDGATSAALISYEAEAGEARPLAHALGASLGLHGIEVIEDLVVLDGRWYCARDDDCPDLGEELPAPADVPGVAGYIAVGRSVLGGRDAVEALVTPLPDDADESLVVAIEAWRRDYQKARETCFRSLLDDVSDPPEDLVWQEAGGSPGIASPEWLASPQDGDVATDPFPAWVELQDECLTSWGRLVRGDLDCTMLSRLIPSLVGPLEDRDLRDALIGWLCPGLLPADLVGERMLRRLGALVGPMDADGGGVDDAEMAGLLDHAARRSRPQLQEALDAVCRATPRRFAAPVLSVSASHAWWSGDGTRAGMCVDIALGIDPDHALSRLIRLGLDHGLRPEAA